MDKEYGKIKLNKKKRRKIKKRFKVFLFVIIIAFIFVLLSYKFSLNKITFNNESYKYSFNNNRYLNYSYKYIKTIFEQENNDNLTDIGSSSYDYSKKVPETEAVLDDYFNDAVFIGDSRTEGFIISNSLSNVTALTAKGLMVDTVFTRPVVNVNGKKVTIANALSSVNFNKVYIMLGVNELGWAYSDLFIEKYSEIIDYVRSINPNAQIYVQSILPVSYEKSSRDKIYNNNNINKYNELIKKMTKDKQVYYLDVYEAVSDDDGNLPQEASPDGVHLKKEYCQIWYEYLKTHTVKEEI